MGISAEFKYQYFLLLVHQTRAGGHDNVPVKQVDISAFSYSKRTGKAEPVDFVKKGTGNGGMMVARPAPALTPSELARKSSESKQSKLLTAAAFCPRPNPPNTELRRCDHNFV